MGKFIHTWHGDLYCGSVPLEVAEEIDGMEADNLLASIDPDGHLVEHGVYHYVDFEGYAVTMKLEEFEHEPN